MEDFVRDDRLQHGTYLCVGEPMHSFFICSYFVSNSPEGQWSDLHREFVCMRSGELHFTDNHMFLNRIVLICIDSLVSLTLFQKDFVLCAWGDESFFPLDHIPMCAYYLKFVPLHIFHTLNMLSFSSILHLLNCVRLKELWRSHKNLAGLTLPLWIKGNRSQRTDRAASSPSCLEIGPHKQSELPSGQRNQSAGTTAVQSRQKANAMTSI